MDLADFEDILRQHGPVIYTLSIRLTNNSSDAEDLAQETFLKAFESLGSFRGEAEIRTWLYRICLNTWKNRVRYERRRSFWRHFSLNASSDEEKAPVEIADNDPPLDNAMEKRDDQTVLERALQQLDLNDRAILLLRDREGFSYESIARELEIPIGTVRSRLARAREKLRQLCLSRFEQRRATTQEKE